MNAPLCPCGSEEPYSECCARFHQGVEPDNALQLMKARYSAYVLNIPDYILKTTHPASPQYTENLSQWKRNVILFSENTHFQKLEIIDFYENGDLATVTFTVFISQGGKDVTFTEKSFFEKRKGKWLYLRGRGEQGHHPELATNIPNQPLPLAYYGAPILTEVAKPIAEITPEIKKLVEEMIATMYASPGMGLAAPQVYQSIRLFIAQPPIEIASGKFETGQLEVFINPEVSDLSSDTWENEEGCLSIPTIRAEVLRPKEITIEYTNLKGDRINKRVSGWEARVILHEYDHIDGILFTQRLNKKERQQLDARLRQLKKRIQDA